KLTVTEPVRRLIVDADAGPAEAARFRAPPPTDAAAPGRPYGLSPLAGGLAVHRGLARIDLTGALDWSGPTGPRDDMVARALLGPDEAEAIVLAAIAAFFRGELGARLAASARKERESGGKASRVYRELPFIMGIDPEAPEAPAGVLQGTIDCLVRD